MATVALVYVTDVKGGGDVVWVDYILMVLLDVSEWGYKEGTWSV